jgi:3-methyl-2-oxobutanoate hydroxymethyltransferase
MSVSLFNKKKQAAKKISMVTCYDYTSATLLAETEIDALLIGDSIAMTIYGFPNTVHATVEMIKQHTAAVARGAPKKFIVADLPFLSYRKSLTDSMDAVLSVMQAGANAVKLEGAKGNLELITHLVDSGIPVLGHLGLTPQSVNTLGGYKVQGKTEESAQAVLDDALAMQQAGCCAIILECIPQALAKEITQRLNIATIGIGAGPSTDGQILVWQDLLGFNPKFKVKFVKQFANTHELVKTAIEQYILEVETGAFPQDEHSF